MRFKSQCDMDRGESKDQIIDTVSALVLDPIWFFFFRTAFSNSMEKKKDLQDFKVGYPIRFMYA